MQEQRHRLAAGRRELRGEPVELLGFARKPGIHHQRIESDKTPPRSLKPPAVFAEQVNISLSVRFRDRVRRSWTDQGRVVADVMIAGQGAAGHWKRSVQRLGKFEIVAVGRAIEGEIAAVDDEIGTFGVDVFAQAVKIVGQRLMAAGKMGVGNLDQTKLGHAAFLPARSGATSRHEIPPLGGVRA